MQPFASIAEVLESYNLFGFIPLIKPISLIPGILGACGDGFRILNRSFELFLKTELVKRAVVHRFDTLQAVPVSASCITDGEYANGFLEYHCIRAYSACRR